MLLPAAVDEDDDSDEGAGDEAPSKPFIRVRFRPILGEFRIDLIELLALAVSF